MYSELQKGLFPLVSILCMTVFYLLYRFGNTPIRGKRGFTERMALFYSFISSALWSKFLFQSLPNATGPSNSQVSVLVTGFIMIGFFIMLAIQKCQRIQGGNHVPEIEIRSIIDHEKMELTEYYQLTELESESVAPDRLQIQDEVIELRKRRRIAYLLLIVMSFLAVMEGFFIVYSEPAVIGGGWAVFSFFFLNKMIDTIIVGVALLHGYIHVKVGRGRNMYLIVSLYWSIVCGLSPMPALLNMEWTESFKMVSHLATGIFYAFAGGFLLWLSVYYIWIDRRREDIRDVAKQLAVFAVTGAVCCIVAFFV